MAEQQEAAPEQVGKHWSDWVALITAVLAVITAFASAESSNVSAAEILAQAQESDTWALYQAESLKSHAYAMQSELLDLLPSDATLQPKREAAKKAYAEAIAKYSGQKVEADQKAKALAAERQRLDLRGVRDGRSVIGLQIAIVLCSVAGLTKKRWLLAAGLFAGLSGVAYYAAAAMI
jgi:hypothetical protein